MIHKTNVEIVCSLCLLYHAIIKPGVHITLVRDSQIRLVSLPWLSGGGQGWQVSRVGQCDCIPLLGRMLICERQCCLTLLWDEMVEGGCLYILLTL